MAQQTQVSPNGVTVPKQGRAARFASGVRGILGNLNAETDDDYLPRRLGDDNNWGVSPRMHFWQGPNREAFGGIGPEFDWRKFNLRPMPQAGSSRRGSQTGRNEAAAKGAGRERYTSGTTTEQGDITMGGTLAWNDQGQGSFAFPELKEPMPSRTQREPGPAKPLWAEKQGPVVQGSLFDVDDPAKVEPLWAKKTPLGKRPYQQSIPGTNF